MYLTKNSKRHWGPERKKRRSWLSSFIHNDGLWAIKTLLAYCR